MAQDQFTEQSSIRIAQAIPCTEAEGPGKRFALWLQGCPLRCPGCCNPEMLPFEGGLAVSAQTLVEQFREARDRDGIEGITLLGGEPLAHAPAAVFLARAAHELSLSVMIFTGYTLEEARGQGNAAVDALLAETDLLVDGPYLRELPETRRRWIGSSNQRIHFLSPRYQADDPRWQRSNTLEIRLRGNEVTVNGFPAAGATGLWKPRWERPSRSPTQPRVGE
jgi:anaerobic ribonucleoside-triphosphate reductase activating protein